MAHAVDRYDSLDVWRGAACLMVILYHSTLVYLINTPTMGTSWPELAIHIANLGNVGVPLFFVISGYCITAAARRVIVTGQGPGAYFWRRFRRIYPPLWCVIIASVGYFLIVDAWLYPGLLSSEPWAQLRPWWYSGWQWFGNLTLTETWRHHIVGGPRGHFPGQAWTLCYEEQFYAVIGALLLVRRWFYPAAAIISLASVAVLVNARAGGPTFAGFFFDGSWLTFAAGILVYWLVSAPHRQSVWLFSAVLLISGGILAGPLGLSGGAAAASLALFLAFGARFDRRIAQSWLTRPLNYCGRMCYSLYLVHQLIAKSVSQAAWNAGFTSASDTVLVVMPLVVAASVVSGRLAFVTIERRFLNTPSFARPSTHLVPGTAGMAP